jgi:hypothetical protein
VAVDELDGDLGLADAAEPVQRLGEHGGRLVLVEPRVQVVEHLVAPREVHVAQRDASEHRGLFRRSRPCRARSSCAVVVLHHVVAPALLAVVRPLVDPETRPGPPPTGSGSARPLAASGGGHPDLPSGWQHRLDPGRTSGVRAGERSHHVALQA